GWSWRRYVEPGGFMEHRAERRGAERRAGPAVERAAPRRTRSFLQLAEQHEAATRYDQRLPHEPRLVLRARVRVHRDLPAGAPLVGEGPLQGARVGVQQHQERGVVDALAARVAPEEGRPVQEHSHGSGVPRRPILVAHFAAIGPTPADVHRAADRLPEEPALPPEDGVLAPQRDELA